MLEGKNIVLGVTGGIAVYKAVELVSRLKKAGAHVHVIMTESATKFVTPLTFREISGNPVITDMWEEPKTWNVQHIALASMAELFLIMPATANIIGKIANGIADDMLSTTVMATTAPVILAPAMNTKMYENTIVQANIKKLAEHGYYVIEPDAGMLACGVEGQGRLPEPVTLVEKITDICNVNTTLQGKKVLITAGGTREPIDPVRYISNHSSGKMGYALAKAAASRGATVTLITAPTNLQDPKGVILKKVNTAQEMLEAVLQEYDQMDIVIKAAAVADYRVSEISEQKIKKTGDTLTLSLKKNPDILYELGKRKKQQLLVGFAAETTDLIKHATEKLHAKNLDMIVANDVTLPGAGFNSDTNIVKLLFSNGHMEELAKDSKNNIAEIILDKIIALSSKIG